MKQLFALGIMLLFFAGCKEEKAAVVQEVGCKEEKSGCCAKNSVQKESIWAKDTLFIDHPPRMSQFVLIKGKLIEDNKRPGFASVAIDTVLAGKIDTKKIKWRIPAYKKRCRDIELNTDYVILATTFTQLDIGIIFTNCEQVLTDTPVNRKKFMDKFKETVVIHKKSDEEFLQKKQNDNLVIWTTKYALLEIRVKENRLNLADGFYADSVLFGELDIDKKFGIFSKKCGELPKGSYLMLASFADHPEPLLFIGACPVPYTEDNLKRLSERWKKCDAYGSIKERRPEPARGDFCGDEENIFDEAK